jgi:phage gp36-like protein
MYCTLADILKQISKDTLIQLTDDNQTGETDTVIVDEAIIYSETLIDGYLRGRYILPLNLVPAVVKIIAVDLSVCRLYSRRFQTETPDAISEKYKNSIKMLEQIQKGIIALNIKPKAIFNESAIFRTNKDSSDRRFSKERLNEY